MSVRMRGRGGRGGGREEATKEVPNKLEVVVSFKSLKEF
jgi:hypothetical protein